MKKLSIILGIALVGMLALYGGGIINRILGRE